MGSPLGPVLANIFVGFHEESLNISSRQDILLYHRYVDDTFALENEEENTKNNSFLEELNRLHPALEFTCEKEDDNKLPFMDIHVHNRQQLMVLTSTLRQQYSERQPSQACTHIGILSPLTDTKQTLSDAW